MTITEAANAAPVLHTMLIGERIRAIREAKKLSQGDIEKSSGLLRVYVSRVENGHTSPSVETLEKFARALEVPLYQLVYEGEERPDVPGETREPRREDRYWAKLRYLLARMSAPRRRLLLALAERMARRRTG